MSRPLCSVAEVAEGEILRVDLPDGRALAVCNLAGEFFATDDLCTHGDASLAEGEIEDGQLVCPFHLGKFDIKTGEATGAPCTIALRTYRVAVEGDEVVLLDG